MVFLAEYFLTVVFGAIFAGILLWKHRSKNKLLPPGPPALPILGNVLQVGRRPHLKLSQWAKKYGPIYRIKLGSMAAVVVTDHKLMKVLFNDPASAGRMVDNPIINEFAKGPNGLACAEGSTFEQQKRFTLKTLKDFGFKNKTSMETLILDEVRTMISWFKNRSSKPISGNRIFNTPVINSLWRIVSGTRCEWEKESPKISTAVNEFFEAVSVVSTNGLLFAPILRHIAPNYLGWTRYVNSIKGVEKLLNESIAEHRQTLDEDNLRDFIDHHLSEVGKTTDSNSSFYKEKGMINLIAAIFDLFFGGSETTSNTLSWTLLYVSNHPTVQRKMHDEINNVIGTNCPSLTHRPSMPYMEAVISEVQRIRPVLGLNIPHRMLADKLFHGYCLPKGTSIFGNIYGVHHDPAIWGDPESFRPERFLSQDGTTFEKHEALITFSEGRRKCIGESLAKDTLFLFLTSIFQQFNVVPSDNDGRKGPDFENDVSYMLIPKPFKIVMIPRQL